MSDRLKTYIAKYVGSTDFICLDMAKMDDHAAAVFMNNDEHSDDYQKNSVVVLEFDFSRDTPMKRITDWEEYYVNEADNLTFDSEQFGNYITSSVDAETGDVIFLRISKGKNKVAKNDTSLSDDDKTNAVNRRLITFTLLCNKKRG